MPAVGACPPVLSCVCLQGKGEDDVEKAARLFADIQQQIDSKQLKPFIRTQYMRSAFQVGTASSCLEGLGRFELPTTHTITTLRDLLPLQMGHEQLRRELHLTLLPNSLTKQL